MGEGEDGEGTGPLEGHLCAAAGVTLQADMLVARTAALGGLIEKGAKRAGVRLHPGFGALLSARAGIL